MKFTNKVLYYLLFTELSPNQARCNTCLKVTKSGNGYTNQFHHLLKRHPDNQELAAAAFRKGNRFGRPLVCKNAKMQPISAATLQKFLDALYGHVREVIATTLPDKFGIALDALTTAFCPLGDEEHLSAQSLFDLIADTLSTYNRPRRFQLPVNDFLADKELLLAKIHALMKHLNTIKCRAALRKVTPLAPVLRSVTRWSSTFNMVERGEESEHVEELLETLMDLNEVTKALQDSTLTSRCTTCI
ncbi:hypothetical protein JG687_00013225 [Phytophthora cactorum]|uniref:BED-type domain-containing protein n=1 Tax=Phytophthora cactorum TaxID=29920 RepID=A0A8T1TZT8_9STRA|nr:hypothetical protein JG687_00013225 [Phytophthora cactorum]